MFHKDTPIQRKLMAVILATTSVALIVSCLGFISYEIFTIKKNMSRALAARAEIIAANSRITLELRHPADATEVMNALQKDPRMVSACIYDNAGKIFARYPTNAPDSLFPTSPNQLVPSFGPSFLTAFCPVVKDDHMLGTIYLKSNLSALTDRYFDYVKLTLIIFCSSLLVAYLLSKIMQRQILQPIQSLAATAKAFSHDGDYSVRATKYGNDELGLLTDTFNQMLAHIHEQNQGLRQSREEFKDLFDHAPLGYHEVDKQGRLTRINQTELKMLGYSAEELLGEFVWKISAEADVSQRAALTKLSGGPPPPAFERILRRRDGSTFPALIEDRIVRNETDQIIAIRAVIQDITERKRAEEEIHQLNLDLEHRVIERTAELEMANKELEAFSYSVSHDLRAPLRAVDGFSQAVEEDYGPQLPEEGRRYLRTIRQEAQRMGVLIDDLLSFSRLSRQPLNRQEMNTMKLARAVLEELNFQQHGRQVEVRIGELPACQGDAVLLKQVWVNLLSNALKYTGKCEAAIIEIGCHLEAGENVYYVRDNGAGFDMQYAHKLFGVFQRLHRADEFEGTGVGLAIVQRIIHRHGGRVWAKSALNQGATFYFTLREKTTP